MQSNSLKSLAINIVKLNYEANFWSQTTWAILRTVVAIMMIHNGFDKLGNLESFAEAYVAYIGLPFTTWKVTDYAGFSEDIFQHSNTPGKIFRG